MKAASGGITSFNGDGRTHVDPGRNMTQDDYESLSRLLLSQNNYNTVFHYVLFTGNGCFNCRHLYHDSTEKSCECGCNAYFSNAQMGGTRSGMTQAFSLCVLGVISRVNFVSSTPPLLSPRFFPCSANMCVVCMHVEHNSSLEDCGHMGKDGQIDCECTSDKYKKQASESGMTRRDSVSCPRRTISILCDTFFFPSSALVHTNKIVQETNCWLDGFLQSSRPSHGGGGRDDSTERLKRSLGRSPSHDSKRRKSLTNAGINAICFTIPCYLQPC